MRISFDLVCIGMYIPFHLVIGWSVIIARKLGTNTN